MDGRGSQDLKRRDRKGSCREQARETIPCRGNTTAEVLTKFNTSVAQATLR